MPKPTLFKILDKRYDRMNQPIFIRDLLLYTNGSNSGESGIDLNPDLFNV